MESAVLSCIASIGTWSAYSVSITGVWDAEGMYIMRGIGNMKSSKIQPHLTRVYGSH